MASAKIALVRSLKAQNKLCVNSDADETLAQLESRYVSKYYLRVEKKMIIFCFAFFV